MRHRKKGRKFGRIKKVRRALFRSLMRSLILEERIRTTEAKAKEIRPKIERLVTKAKKNTLASRREVLMNIADEASIKKIFSEIAPKFRERPGGYTRIIKLPPRGSDNAKMAIIEFVK
jgi:large subunit ribosomal protein L17